MLQERLNRHRVHHVCHAPWDQRFKEKLVHLGDEVQRHDVHNPWGGKRGRLTVGKMGNQKKRETCLGLELTAKHPEKK